MTYYSQLDPAIFDNRSRQRVAGQILAVLGDLKLDLSGSTCLDMGCSSGIITDYLRPRFKKIIGIDVDARALPKRSGFLLMNAAHTSFPDNSFDVIICHQVYCYLQKPAELFPEIYRLLKPGGVCYLSGRPRLYAFLEKTSYPTHYLWYSDLQNLTQKFLIRDYTSFILRRRLGINLPIPAMLLPNIIWSLTKSNT